MDPQTLADYARQSVSTLRDILPNSLLDVIDVIYFNIVSLTERYFDLTDISFADALASLNLQSLLPPLISILTIYFALISLYRTTTFFVRTTIFLVKWGALIGATGAALGYIANVVMPNSFVILTQSTTRRKPYQSAKPRVWDSFEEHQRWREAQHAGNPFVADAGRVAREMVEKIVDATQQATGQGGWWSTLTGLAAKTLVGEEAAAQVKGKRISKDAREKGKSR